MVVPGLDLQGQERISSFCLCSLHGLASKVLNCRGSQNHFPETFFICFLQETNTQKFQGNDFGYLCGSEFLMPDLGDCKDRTMKSFLDLVNLDQGPPFDEFGI